MAHLSSCTEKLTVYPVKRIVLLACLVFFAAGVLGDVSIINVGDAIPCDDSARLSKFLAEHELKNVSCPRYAYV